MNTTLLMYISTLIFSNLSMINRNNHTINKYCDGLPIDQCNQNCIICNINQTNIEPQIKNLPYCSKKEYCISNITECNSVLFLDKCIFASTYIKMFFCIFILALFISSFYRLQNLFLKLQTNNIVYKFILWVHFILSIILPCVLIVVTNTYYLEGLLFIIVLSGYIHICTPNSNNISTIKNPTYDSTVESITETELEPETELESITGLETEGAREV